MTRKLVDTPATEEPKPKRKARVKSEPKANHPEFNLVVNDKDYDLETSLTLSSNHGSDKKKTLYHARSKKMQRPILLEIDCEVQQYNIKSFSLTTNEAKDMIKELQRMVDYLEEV